MSRKTQKRGEDSHCGENSSLFLIKSLTLQVAWQMGEKVSPNLHIHSRFSPILSEKKVQEK